jgi:hypothetical protein
MIFFNGMLVVTMVPTNQPKRRSASHVVNVIKLFSSSQMAWQNKLDSLSLAHF